MELESLIDPLENRFKFVEAETEGEALAQISYSNIKSLIRGGIVGGIVGYAVSGGNEKLTIYASIVGAITDLTQNALRAINLIGIKKNNPQLYKELKQNYSEIFNQKY